MGGTELCFRFPAVFVFDTYHWRRNRKKYSKTSRVSSVSAPPKSRLYPLLQNLVCFSFFWILVCRSSLLLTSSTSIGSLPVAGVSPTCQGKFLTSSRPKNRNGDVGFNPIINKRGIGVNPVINKRGFGKRRIGKNQEKVARLRLQLGTRTLCLLGRVRSDRKFICLHTQEHRILQI